MLPFPLDSTKKGFLGDTDVDNGKKEASYQTIVVQYYTYNVCVSLYLGNTIMAVKF